MLQNNKFAIGCMRWGNWGANFSTREYADVITFCVDHGLTLFDHADIYGGYTVEHDFGKGLKESSVRRESIKIMTKCGIQYPSEVRNFKLKSYHYSEEYITKCVEQSLKNFQTDYLDYVLLHRPSPLMNYEEMAHTFQKLELQGKVKYFGVSNFSPLQFELLNALYPLVTNQVEISLSKTDCMFDGTLDLLMKEHKSPMAWSPLGNYFTDEIKSDLKETMQTLCNQYGATESQLLLAFLQKHPSKIIPVIGSTKKERIQEAVQSQVIQLDLEDWFLLLEKERGFCVP